MIILLTCTSDRPVALRLCARWVGRAWRQYHRRDQLVWLIVDDGETAADLSALAAAAPRVQIEYVRLSPEADPVQSFCKNNTTGLAYAHTLGAKHLIWVEDDDYYPAHFLSRLVELQITHGYKIVGEARARYINFSERAARQHSNANRASLCQTSIDRSLIEQCVLMLEKRSDPFLDIDLWRFATSGKNKVSWYIYPESTIVGVKGFPGKKGLGIGHRMRLEYNNAEPLSAEHIEWLGPDAWIYREIFNESDSHARS